MDKPNDQKWFSKITPPESALGGSVDYLDRLIGHGPQRQAFLQPKRRHEPKKKKQPHGHQNKFKKPISRAINLDDASWLAERRKKFPKTGSQKQCEKPEHETKKERKKTLFEKLMEQ